MVGLTMKSTIICDVTPLISTDAGHLLLVPCLVYFLALKMEIISSPKRRWTVIELLVHGMTSKAIILRRHSLQNFKSECRVPFLT